MQSDGQQEPHVAPHASHQSTPVGKVCILVIVPHRSLTVSPLWTEVAIPRLTQPDRQPIQSGSGLRHRVSRACRNCHKRKVKCSGGLPRCNFCEKFNKSCVYESSRKDRLAEAISRNERLTSILKDLTGRVEDEDRARIESALNDSDDEEYDSPVPGSAGRSSRFPYSQFSDLSRRQSGSQTSPLRTLFTPENELLSPAHGPRFFPAVQGSDYDAESLSEHTALFQSADEAGYLGQISEVQWIRSLKQRAKVAIVIPPVETAPPSETNFYLDNDGIRLLNSDNPFHLPLASQATVLARCYFQTVQITFPIIPSDVEEQLQIYHTSMQNGRPVIYPESWYAIINLVLAIGARFSHITNAEWHSDPLDESLYISRAYQLLGLNDTAVVLSAPNLPRIQAIGLLAFYYMAIGHVNRAWITAGAALRAAITCGLHAQSQYSSSEPKRRQATTQTWWSLYNLESQLSSMIGRPCMLRSEDVTTPLPSEVTEPLRPSEVIRSESSTYPDSQVRLAILAQNTLWKLYTERKIARSWAQIHNVMNSLMLELEDWTSEAITPYTESSRAAVNYEMQRTILQFQYYRLKLLIYRPALRRIERCCDTNTEDFVAFDQEAAEACIQTAQDVAALLPETLDAKKLYEKGPWWSIIHNIMQSLTILLIAISARQHFEPLYGTSLASTKKLVTWLQYLRDNNDAAKRAYQVVYGIVRAPTSNPAVWKDITSMFPDEIPVPQTSMPEHTGNQVFHTWSGTTPVFGKEGYY